MPKQYLIKSFCMVNDEGRKRPARGMLGLKTHETLSSYVSGFRDDLIRHGEWLIINGMDVSVYVKKHELEAACNE